MMIYTRPDYFDEFQCIAERCPDTCCAGWQIMIDDESMEKYKKIKGDYLWKVMAGVDWENKCFRQDNEKRCAFLNSDNLCDLYEKAGKENLCKTCREYPRHTEEFDGVREISLSASCPVIASMIMERITPVTFVTEEREEKESEYFEDFDPFLYSVIEEARTASFLILQDREIPIRERVVLVLGMAHDMQRRINHRELFSCDKVIAKYQRQKAKDFVHTFLATKTIQEEEELAREMFPLIYELEVLHKDWETFIHRSEEILFFSMQESFVDLKTEFEQWKQTHKEVDIHLEQIMVYFIFTYFLGSVYDGQVFAKVQMAGYCTWMIELLWMSRWIMNGRQIQLDEMTELFYRFCREVEHSDANLNALDKMMVKKWLI